VAVVVAGEPLPEFKVCINWFKRFVDVCWASSPVLSACAAGDCGAYTPSRRAPLRRLRRVRLFGDALIRSHQAPAPPFFGILKPGRFRRRRLSADLRRPVVPCRAHGS